MTYPLVETVARAWDAEEAAQMGEPSPWDHPDSDPIKEDAWRDNRMSLARAALQAIEAAGWRVVPVRHPSRDMIYAAAEGHYGKKAVKGLGPNGIDLTVNGKNWTFADGFTRMYRAAIQAAPKVAP